MVSERFPGTDWNPADLPRGTDRDALQREVDRLFGSPATHGRTLALLAVHKGNVVLERYDPEHNHASTFISWSMAKSITHALVGMAVGDGFLSLSDRDLFPEWAADARAGITLQHLLNMASGLEWTEDYVDDSVSDVIEMLAPGRHGDHAAFALAKPLAHAPGSHFCYSSGTTNIITRILSRALGDEPPGNSAMKAHIARLFDAVGMSSATAKHDASGNFVGSSFVYATARDYARFGWLYLNDGVWDGVQVLPEGWVDHGRTWFADEPETGVGYGAHWWLHHAVPGSMNAQGYQGQLTWVVPDRDLVLVRLGITDSALMAGVRDSLVGIIRAFPAEIGGTDKSGGHE